MTVDLGAAGRRRPLAAALLARYRYAGAALDQVALSVFGFALNLCLLRTLSTTDYGVVSLWMTMALLLISIQGALVGGPLSVYLPAATEPGAASRLRSAIATMNLLSVLLTVAATGAVCLVADAEWAAHDPLTLLAIPLFLAAGMYREYYRATAFSRRDMALLLGVDVPYLAVTAGALFAIVLWPQRFASAAAAFLAMSVGCVVSQLCVRARGEGAEEGLFRRGWLRTYRAISGEVAWSLTGVVANHVESRSYVYLATSLCGIAALAAINAVGVLFRPVSVLVQAWGQYALPQLSAALANGRTGEFSRALARALVGTAVASILLAALLLAAWPPIERFAFAGKYPDGALLLVPWAAASTATVLRYVGSVGLMAAREFAFLAKAQALCGLIAAAATAGFILWQGYTAAMWGIALGNAVCFGWEMLRLRGVGRRIASAGPRGGAPAAPA